MRWLPQQFLSFVEHPHGASPRPCAAGFLPVDEARTGDRSAEGVGRHDTLGDRAGWSNTIGLPNVKVLSPSEAFFSNDIADGPDDGGVFRPTFGCKCGAWGPAWSHPEIDFRQGFLEAHPDLLRRAAKLRVHLEDVGAGKVHWDATYDIRRFATQKQLDQMNFSLTQTMPAEPRSGTQRRFQTLCPIPGPGRQYELRVTVLDRNGAAIEYFHDQAMRLSATLPRSEHQTENTLQVLPDIANG